jgi:AcrR family transcriptional regulator
MTDRSTQESVAGGRDPERTRTAILDATLQALDEHGEVGVRVAKIAEVAGVTTGAVYAHFRSRDGLIAAAQVHYLRQQYVHYMDSFDSVHATDIEAAGLGEDQYMVFIRGLFSPAGQAARLRWAEAIDRALTDEELAEELRPIEFALVDHARVQIEALQEAGYVAPELDARAVAALRVAASVGAALTAPLYADDPEFKDKLLAAWPYIVRAFAPRPPRPDTQSEPVE